MIIRSMFNKPATLMHPVVKRDWHERTRGRIKIDIDDCIFCGICVKKCPTKALCISKEEKSWTIRRMQCILCDYCVEVCPKKCLICAQDYMEPDVIKTVDRYDKQAAVSDGDGAAREDSADPGKVLPT